MLTKIQKESREGVSMDIENTGALQNWILKVNLTDEVEKEIENLINAFSEYLVSTNPDYLYNKTYLPSFMSDFFKCQIKLKEKYLLIQRDIVDTFSAKNFNMAFVTICIDEIWEYKNGKYKLLNSINVSTAQNSKIKLELKYGKEQEVVLADELDLNTGYESYIKTYIQKFIDRVREYTNDEKV